MVKRKARLVQIPLSKTPHGVSVEGTLRALDKLAEKYVRNHKGEKETKPFAPEVKLSLTNGDKVHGELGAVSEFAVEVHPYIQIFPSGYILGTEYGVTTVVDVSSIVSVKHQFRKREVGVVYKS